MTDKKKKLIVIAGPTCTGKSKAGVDLSLAIGGEVISADSMQVYRGMDIGTAKIPEVERRGIRHHLIDVLDIDQDLSVSLYKEMGVNALEEIRSAGHTPVIAGGTGFFIQALIYDIDFMDFPGDTSLERAQLDALDIDELTGILIREDEQSLSGVDIKNKRRIINAILFHRATGRSIAEHNRKEAKKRNDPPYDISFFVLYGDRSQLYEKIDRRVDLMMEAGLLDEVSALMGRGLSPVHTAGQAIGYKELMRYILGEIGYEDAVSLIKTDTRHYFKRQLTWFKRESRAHWINISRGDPIDEIMGYLS